MTKKKEAGFAAIGIVLVVVAIVAVGLAGWYVWSKQTDKNTNQTSSAVEEAEVAVDDNQGATTYLDIPEWGVKFALTSDTADAYYDNTTTSPLDSFSLRSHSLDSEPDCTTGSQSVATIFRVPKDAQDDMLPGKTYRETQDGQVIGDYFYFIQGAQYSCTEGMEQQIQLQKVRNGFITAGPTIQQQ